MPIVSKAKPKAKPAKPKAKPAKPKAKAPPKPKASIAPPQRAKAPPKPPARSGMMKAMDILEFQTLTPSINRTYRGYTPEMMKKERAYLKTLEPAKPKKGEILKLFNQNK
jgi:hypothetical protein